MLDTNIKKNVAHFIDSRIISEMKPLIAINKLQADPREKAFPPSTNMNLNIVMNDIFVMSKRFISSMSHPLIASNGWLVTVNAEAHLAGYKWFVLLEIN